MKNSAPNFKFTGKAKELMNINDHITIIDNKAALIENCKQILECNEVLARVLTRNFEVEIWGKDLSLNNFCTECVEVRGQIQSINLTAKRKNEV